ncbi:hypothetical protein ABEB36_000665 [Hypothenemus hampei]|uniref:Uncharacterized protein n=1 Tax=Hypothenemus hampei TaxID=57062 RepID=A0ABD1FCL6_HYPHA
MLKLFFFVLLVSYGSAGLVPLDDGYGLGLGGPGILGHGIALAAPKVIAAPAAIAVKTGATSYQNSNLISLHATPVVTKAIAAPYAAPIAAPIITKVAAPVGVVGYDGTFLKI